MQCVCMILVAVLALAAEAAAAAAAAAAAVPKRPGYGFVGDTCSNGTGVCRVFDRCPEAIAALQQKQEPKICSFVNQFTPTVCCPTKTKAVRMCEKYGESVWTYEKNYAIPPQIVPVDTCAVSGIPFIAGGDKADSNEFPHMALLGYGDNPKDPIWQCGGSLISNRYILTAAHCLQTNKGSPRWVRLGELSLHTDRERNKHADYEVERPIPHPNYHDSIYYDDIALLRLKNDVTFTASIRPACIYSLPEVEERELIASGWGYTNWANPEINDHLMKVKLPIQSNKICQDAYKTLTTTNRLRNGITEHSMVCAGTLKAGKDTCRGDSGGPLQLKLSTPYCMYSIVGVTSFGKAGCGVNKSPAVYTRVSNYVPWIESIVWPNDV